MSHWNPARGNRKAGTKPSPNWRANKMVIPAEPWLDRCGFRRNFYEVMQAARRVEHRVHGETVVSLYQAPREGFTYGCSPEDAVHVLNLLPEKDVADIAVIAFRQPTRKQTLLEPVWGRLIYHAEFERAEGRCIMLEAQEPDLIWKYPRKRGLELAAEMARLRADGHQLVENRRGWELSRTEESIRNTLLYRTLPHEVGHHVQEKRFTSDPIFEDDFCAAWDAYWACPSREKEDSAHLYADEIAAELRAKALIPFAPRSVAGPNTPTVGDT